MWAKAWWKTTQTYARPRYKRGIGQTDNNTWPACDEQQEAHSGCTDWCQMVNCEATCEDVPEGHKRWHVYVIAWVGGLCVASGTRAPQSQLQTRNSKTTWPWEHITWPYMWLITWPLRHSYTTWLISTWPWEPMTPWPWEDSTWPIKELVINNVTWQDALWTRV